MEVNKFLEGIIRSDCLRVLTNNINKISRATVIFIMTKMQSSTYEYLVEIGIGDTSA